MRMGGVGFLALLAAWFRISLDHAGRLAFQQVYWLKQHAVRLQTP